MLQLLLTAYHEFVKTNTLLTVYNIILYNIYYIYNTLLSLYSTVCASWQCVCCRVSDWARPECQPAGWWPVDSFARGMCVWPCGHGAATVAGKRHMQTCNSKRFVYKWDYCFGMVCIQVLSKLKISIEPMTVVTWIHDFSSSQQTQLNHWKWEDLEIKERACSVENV